MWKTWTEWREILDRLPFPDLSTDGGRVINQEYTPLYCHIMDYTWMYDGSCPDRVIDVPMNGYQGRLLKPVITDMRLREQFRQDRRRFPRDHKAMVVLVNPVMVKRNKRRYRQHRRVFRERNENRNAG